MVIEKEVGQTPLQAVEAMRAWYPGLKDAKMAYAGRLDPMASGKLLVLLGEECKRQEKYHKLDKTYTVEVLLGASSDTGDVLGRIEGEAPHTPLRHPLIKAVAKLRGRFSAPYPIFSSRTVAGKPLHTWALEGRLNEIEIPMNTTRIYSIRIDKVRTETGQKIYDDAIAKVRSLPTVTEESKALGADFRREDVEADWRRFLHKYETEQFTIVTITATVSAGTYMRTVAEVIGKNLGVKALAFSIHRTKLGKILRIPLLGSFWYQEFK